MRRCPALFVSGPASNSGKTTVTAALARKYLTRGRRARVFKTGPDFLDPMILEQASGAPVYNLDLFMGREDHCERLLYDSAADADLILIEGVMGLFDGEPSSADLAKLFGIPVLAVIDGSAMAQTFGTVEPTDWRVIARMSPLPACSPTMSPASAMRIALPSRHLGLIPAGEIGDFEARQRR